MMTEKMEGSFLTTPFTGKNAFWRYLILTFTPFIVSNTIGALPLWILILLSPSASSLATTKGALDFASLGINLNLGFAFTLFPFLLALLTIIILIKPLHDRSFNSIINGTCKIRWGRIFVAAGIWTIISAFYLYFSIKNDPSNFVLTNTSGSIITLALLAIILIPFQAGFEEILFRGYLTQGLAVMARNRWVPIVVTSLLFGLMHGLNPEVKEYGFFTMIPQYIFFGLVFSVLAMMDDGIELAIGAHTANNIFLSVMVTSKNSALQTPALYEQIEMYPWRDFAGLVVMSLIFIAIMAVIYKWRGLTKLYGKIAEPSPVRADSSIQ